MFRSGSGRIKTDSINEQRIETVLNRFNEWAQAHGEINRFSYAVTKQQAERSLIAFPAAGFAFGVLSSYAFVHPNSRYVGKFFTLLTTWIGYKVHKEYVEGYNHFRRFGNFWNYPADIRKMIDNNDSRYAFRWLKENYLSISEAQ